MLHDDSQPIIELKWLAQFFGTYGNERSAREIYKDVKKARRVAQNSLNEEDASNVVEFGSPQNKPKEAADTSGPVAELRWLAQFFTSRGHHDSAREINEQLKRLGYDDDESGSSASYRPSYSLYNSAQVLKELQWLLKFFMDHGDEPGARQTFALIKKARMAAQKMLKQNDTLEQNDESAISQLGADGERQRSEWAMIREL